MVTTEPVTYEGVQYDSLMDQFHKELPKGERSDMTQTFGRRGQGGQAANNFVRYVLDGFLILSPIDILVMQDYKGRTNWMASFAKYLEAESEREEANRHWMQPWMFCLTHMVAEGAIRESNEEDLQKMFIIIEKMRFWMWNRVRPDLQSDPNYALPTFVEWTGESQNHERNRFAQFCWFLASSGGNFNIPTAGTWFPYCAWSRDVQDLGVNGEFGLHMNDADLEELKNSYRGLNLEQCQARQAVMHAHAGPLAAMPKTELSLTQDFQPVTERLSRSGTPTVRAPPRRRKKKPPAPALSDIPEERLLRQPFGTTSFVEGLDAIPQYELNVSAHVTTPTRVSPDPSVHTPVVPLVEPSLNQRVQVRKPPRPPGPPGDPYVIHEYQVPTQLPFNYMPYIILGAVLIGLAYITDER